MKIFRGNQFIENDSKERFWSKIDKKGEDECWNWLASYRGFYGQFWVNGNMIKSHRYAYEIIFGKIPEGMCVLHKCDNPKCCNPEHLFLGTQEDNIHDACIKVRGHFRLNWRKVNEVRELYKTGKYTQRQLVKLLSISLSNVSKIISNKIWKI